MGAHGKRGLVKSRELLLQPRSTKTACEWETIISLCLYSCFYLSSIIKFKKKVKKRAIDVPSGLGFYSIARCDDKLARDRLCGGTLRRGLEHPQWSFCRAHVDHKLLLQALVEWSIPVSDS